MADLTTVLLVGIAVAAFIQPNAPRFFAAVSFVAITLSHEMFLSGYDGLQYYGSAALFDLGIMVVTSGINPVPKMVIRLHQVCMVSILVNVVGWLLWFLYYPPNLYDIAFTCIYAYTLVLLIRRDGLNGRVGGYTMDWWASCFRFNRRSCRNYISLYGGKICTSKTR